MLKGVAGSPLRWQRPSTLLSVFLTLLNDRLGESMVFPLLPYLMAGLSSDGRTLGALAGTYALAQFTGTPLIGALSDRFGRKPVITVCVAGSVLGLSLFAATLILPWAQLWPQALAAGVPLGLLFLARFIDGLSGGTAATATAVLADITPPEERAKAFGLVGVAFGLAFILGPALAGLLARFSLTLPLLLAAAFALLNLVVVLKLLPETLPPSQRLPLPRRRALQPFNQIGRILGQSQVRLLALAFFLFFLSFNGFTAMLVLFLRQAFAWGPELSALAFLVVGVVATVVQGGLIGPLVARFGERRLSLTGVGFVSVGFLLIALAQRTTAVPLVFGGVALLALGTGLVTPCLRSLVSRRLEDGGQGAALGSMQALQSLAGVLGPPMAGLAFETIGQRSPFWVGLALMLVVGVLVGGLPGQASPSRQSTA
jgi:MFS family permease